LISRLRILEIASGGATSAMAAWGWEGSKINGDKQVFGRDKAGYWAIFLPGIINGSESY